MENGRMLMGKEKMIEEVDENKIGVVNNLGVKYKGNYEFKEKLKDEMEKMKKKKGIDIDINVDEERGGFMEKF